MIFLVSNF